MIELYPQSEFPRLQDYKLIFDVTPDTIFAYDHKIYTNNELPDHIIVHEMTHFLQQDEHGLDEWVTKYLQDPQFRLEMEIQAYQVQLKSIKHPKARVLTMMESAKNLASPLYGNLVSYKEALKLLKA